MKSIEKNVFRIVIGPLFLGMLAMVAYYTVVIRAPYSYLSEAHHHWSTGSTLGFANNWFNEGAWKLGWRMLENPRSIEFRSLDDRSPYCSYPPGAVLPIYFMSRLKGREATLDDITEYNEFNQFVIALLLSGFVWMLLEGSRLRVRGFASLLAGCFYLLAPGPMYMHHNVFFADQAIILPYVTVIFLELALSQSRLRKTRWLHRMCEAIQSFVLFYACLTDWLAYCLIPCLVLKRVLEDRSLPSSDSVRRAITPVLIGASALILFVLHLGVAGLLPRLKNRFLYRAAISDTGRSDVGDFWNIFWLHMIPDQLGPYSPIILIAALAIVLFGVIAVIRHPKMPAGRRDKIMYAFLLAIPCFLQIHLLRNHSIKHDFSVLKLSLVFGTLPFILVPAILLSNDTPAISKKLRWRDFTALALLILGTEYLCFLHARWRLEFPTVPLPLQDVASWIHDHSTYNDVYFSPDFDIPTLPPQRLAISEKRVYQVASEAEIKQFMAEHVPGGGGVVNVILSSLYKGNLSKLGGQTIPIDDGSEWVVKRLQTRELNPDKDLK